MKRKFSLTIIAAIVLSLIIPIGIGGAPVAKAATKPAQAKLPEIVCLQKWNQTLYFDEIRIPSRATSVQMYLRTTGKYVKTVKQNTYQYKKYKKNKKSYILVKNKGKKTYKVYKAGKWKKIVTTAKKNNVVYNKSLKSSKVYQLKVRGKKGTKTGKFSKILQFKTISKASMTKAKEEYLPKRQEAKDDIAYWKEHLSDPPVTIDDPDDEDYGKEITSQDRLDSAMEYLQYVNYRYSKELFISKGILDNQIAPDEGYYFYYEKGSGSII